MYLQSLDSPSKFHFIRTLPPIAKATLSNIATVFQFCFRRAPPSSRLSPARALGGEAQAAAEQRRDSSAILLIET
jgi:hypothetical protein